MGVIDEVDSVDFSSTMKSSQRNTQTPTAGGHKPSSAQTRGLPPQIISRPKPKSGMDYGEEDANVGEEEYDQEGTLEDEESLQGSSQFIKKQPTNPATISGYQ